MPKVNPKSPPKKRKEGSAGTTKGQKKKKKNGDMTKFYSKIDVAPQYIGKDLLFGEEIWENGVPEGMESIM